MLKNMKWWSILSSAAMIAAGFLLVIFPDVSVSAVCTVIGAAFAVWGIVKIISYFTLSIEDFLYRYDLVAGLLFLMIGLLILYRKELLLNLIPLILGLVIVISGIAKLQNAVVARRIGYGSAGAYLLMAAVSIVFGFVIMFFLSGTMAAATLFMLIGAGLIYSGASDLYVTLFLSGKYRKFMKEYEKSLRDDRIIDAEAEDHEVK